MGISGIRTNVAQKLLQGNAAQNVSSKGNGLVARQKDSFEGGSAFPAKALAPANAAAPVGQASAKSYSEQDYEKAVEQLYKHFDLLDTAGGGWMNSRKDGKIGEADLEAAMGKDWSSTLKEACQFFLDNPDAFKRLESTVNGTCDGKIGKKDVETEKTRIDMEKARAYLSSDKPSIEDILENYQTEEDEMVKFRPVRWLSFKEEELAKKEATLLDGLNWKEKLDMNGIREKSFDVADSKYPNQGKAHGHNDAFRHAYWNALLVQRFGAEWAEKLTTAHEGRPGDTNADNAMDLYNNEVGRQIALANPNASEKELATLIEQAISDGKLLVFDAEGNLDWSNNVSPGQTGHPQ